MVSRQASVAPKGGRVVGWGGVGSCFTFELVLPCSFEHDCVEGRRLATIVYPEKTKTALYFATFMKSPLNGFL